VLSQDEVNDALILAAATFNPFYPPSPILKDLTTNTVSKATVAAISGGARFALRIVPGLALSILATWVAAGFVSLRH